MNYIRSILFNGAFYLWTGLCTLLTLLALPMPLKWAYFPQDIWAWGTNKLLWIAGMRVEVRGLENIPDSPCLISSKHQSAFDTVVFFSILPKAAIVYKKELLGLPIFGWYLKKIEEIPIDRSAGGAALKEMVRAAKTALGKGRSIIIFPEGTRVDIGKKKVFQPGIYALFKMLNVPVVPVALNSGYFWPRRQFLKKPGTIVLEFLPPILGAMKKEAFMTRLENEMEAATTKLLAEARTGEKSCD